MEKCQIEEILKDTAYVRTGGSKEEQACAMYLKELCARMNLDVWLEGFEVDLAHMHKAHLWIDGEEIACKGYLCAGCGDVEAPLYYLTNKDTYSLKQCKGKIVLLDERVGYWMFQDLIEHGAVGFITYDGNVHFADEDIDQRELRSYISNGRKLPGVNINAKKAVEIIHSGAQKARILLEQTEYKGCSYNVVAELPGEVDEWIVVNAHYDTTGLSSGAYDNMSGCIGVLGVAEAFCGRKHRYGLRFIWHGSEEKGLLGSKAYCIEHEKDLHKIVLNINMDMIGCIMGRFAAICTAEEKLVHYIQYMAAELGMGMDAKDGVRSSDSTPFADKGIPAVSFARYAPSHTAMIHNRYDTWKVMSPKQLEKDIAFIVAFTERMATAKDCPVTREIPEKMREKLDVYLNRKRAK